MVHHLSEPDYAYSYSIHRCPACMHRLHAPIKRSGANVGAQSIVRCGASRAPQSARMCHQAVGICGVGNPGGCTSDEPAQKPPIDASALPIDAEMHSTSPMSTPQCVPSAVSKPSPRNMKHTTYNMPQRMQRYCTLGTARDATRSSEARAAAQRCALPRSRRCRGRCGRARRKRLTRL